MRGERQEKKIRIERQSMFGIENFQSVKFEIVNLEMPVYARVSYACVLELLEDLRVFFLR